MNDADIEMAELAQISDEASATKTQRPFDRKLDGPKLQPYVEDAVFYMRSVYVAVTTCANDYGFAHDDEANQFSFEVAQRYKRKLEAEEARMRQEMQ